jgi:hypothetical protein
MYRITIVLRNWMTLIWRFVYSTNLNEKHNHFESLTPKVQIIGEYEASGRILLLPISGKGNVTLTVGKYIGRHRSRPAIMHRKTDICLSRGAQNFQKSRS